MISRRLFPSLIAVCTLAVTAGIGLIAPPFASATAPTALYANPQGGGTSCNAIDPCAITTAFTALQASDQLILQSGSYGTAATPIGTSLVVSAPNTSIFGQPGKPVPVIYSDASVGINLSVAASLNGVELNVTGTKAGLVVAQGGTASHVAVRATKATACAVNGTVIDSLCTTAGTNASAVSGVQTGGTFTPVVRGVTAEATNAASTGIDFTATDNESISATITNVIAHGGLADLEAQATSSTGTSAVTVSHSDYATSVASGDPAGTATVINGPANRPAPPKFVDAATGDYHVLKGSVTVNNGAADPTNDLTDLDGRPRTLGSSPDIGAYELPQAPTVAGFVARKVTAKKAELSVRVDPEGLATTVRYAGSNGKTNLAAGKAVHVGAGGAPVTVTFVLSGLIAKTTYRLQVIAKNADGVATSKVLKVKTR
jgi:hypothetical protein